jgi:hypothetical protein
MKDFEIFSYPRPKDPDKGERWILRRSQQAFQTCTTTQDPKLVPELLREIDTFLAIQYYEPANASPYFPWKWRSWTQRFSGRACPVLKQIDVINPPNTRTVEEWKAGKAPAETHYLWQAQLPDDCQGRYECAYDRAVECAGWFGAGFILPATSAERAKGVVKTDPTWWKDNTKYTPDPFDAAYGYEHRMATSGLPPGDLWGALNRENENCWRYSADMTTVMVKKLQKVNCDGFGWYCMTECK